MLLRLWDSRTLGVRPELVQFFRIFTTLSRALVTGKSASPEPKHAKTQDLFAKLWARLWAEVHSKQQYFEPWNVSFTAYAALWTDSSSSLDFKITMAIVNENDHRTWMFLDLMATCLDLMPEEFSKDKGARAGTAAATSPIEQICNGIMEARGVPQLLVLQLAYAWLARGGKNDTLDLIGLAQCLVDAISYEDSETTAWILLSLGTLCRTMCKEPSRRATDVYRRLGAIVSDAGLFWGVLPITHLLHSVCKG